MHMQTANVQFLTDVNKLVYCFPVLNKYALLLCFITITILLHNKTEKVVVL